MLSVSLIQKVSLFQCDGDPDVDYSGGIRGLGRDDGLGINHFDRNGQCGTTAEPKPVNWELEVTNGVYAVTVDFGEVHYSQGCETEGVLCHDAMGGSGAAGSACIFQGAVNVMDGRFTATGYSHDTGLCHSISMVQIKGGAGAGAPVEARVCEGSTLDIACEEGTIDVMSASYGRQHGPDVCPHAATSDQNCDAVNSMDIVGAACQGETSCSVAATNGVFGDQCGGTYKYLTVNYLCNTAPTQHRAHPAALD